MDAGSGGALGSGGGVHDGAAGSHAADASAAGVDNYRQIGKRKGNGRLLLGAAHSYHASSVAAAAAAQGGGASPAAAASLALGSVPSIPSRFETVLYAGDQEPDAFNSRVARFKSAPVDLPGPGSYAGDVVAASAALKTNSTSWSSKGLGVGFVSKEQRFKRRGGGPGPGAYAVHTIDTLHARTSSAPNRGSALAPGTAAFKSASSAALDPTLAGAVKNNNPGPGYYETTPSKSATLTAVELQRKRTSSGSLGSSASASALAAQFQAASMASPPAAFNSREGRFRPAPSGAPSSSGASAAPGPGGYDPHYGSIEESVRAAAATKHANFKSTTERTDFTYKSTNVPGPGAYSKPVTEEKSGEAAAYFSGSAVGADGRPASPSRAFKVTGQDRFGRPVERKTAAENLPGPGSYDPYIPGVRGDSPIRGGPTLPPGAAGTGRARARNAAMLSPSSPLAASQSHGIPVRSAASAPAAGSPEARLVGSPSAAAAATTARRKKRAAGVGGPGRSLLATRGGPGVALNSPALLMRPQSIGTFGRAGVQPPAAGTALFDSPLAAAHANSPAVVKDSEIRPPGPAWYNAANAFHSVQDKKAFHLNTSHRWM